METKGFFPLFEKVGEGKLLFRTFYKNGYGSTCKGNLGLRYNLNPHKKPDLNAYFHISICHILEERILGVWALCWKKSLFWAFITLSRPRWHQSRREVGLGTSRQRLSQGCPWQRHFCPAFVLLVSDFALRPKFFHCKREDSNCSAQCEMNQTL